MVISSPPGCPLQRAPVEPEGGLEEVVGTLGGVVVRARRCPTSVRWVPSHAWNRPTWSPAPASVAAWIADVTSVHERRLASAAIDSPSHYTRHWLS